MTVEMLIQLVMSLGVLPALFVFLFVHTLKQHEKDKTESKAREELIMKQAAEREEALMKQATEREETLMQKLDEYNAALQHNTQMLDKIFFRMDSIEQICRR